MPLLRDDDRRFFERLKSFDRCAGPTVALADVPLVESDGATRSEIQVFPDGIRVHPFFGEMRFDATFRSDLANEFNAAGAPRPVDVNHSSMLAFDYDGGKAYGWIEKLDDRGADGLWARVRWTDSGVSAIRSGEYAFISPEFTRDSVDRKTGEKTGRPKLLAAALTNRPFLEGMAALAASETASEPAASGHEEVAMTDTKGPDSGGTGDAVSLAEVTKRLTALEAENVKLKAKADADAATLSEIGRTEKVRIVERHQKEGRVVPANLPAVMKLAEVSDAAELDTYLSGLPRLVTGSTPAGAVDAPDASGLGDNDRKLLKAIGVSEDTWRKFSKAKSVRLDGTVVLEDGSTVKLTEFGAGRA